MRCPKRTMLSSLSWTDLIYPTMKTLSMKHGKAVLKKRHTVDNPVENIYFGLYLHQFVLFYYPENGDSRILFATRHNAPAFLKSKRMICPMTRRKGNYAFRLSTVEMATRDIFPFTNGRTQENCPFMRNIHILINKHLF